MSIEEGIPSEWNPSLPQARLLGKALFPMHQRRPLDDPSTAASLFKEQLLGHYASLISRKVISGDGSLQNIFLGLGEESFSF